MDSSPNSSKPESKSSHTSSCSLEHVMQDLLKNPDLMDNPESILDRIDKFCNEMSIKHNAEIVRRAGGLYSQLISDRQFCISSINHADPNVSWAALSISSRHLNDIYVEDIYRIVNSDDSDLDVRLVAIEILGLKLEGSHNKDLAKPLIRICINDIYSYKLRVKSYYALVSIFDMVCDRHGFDELPATDNPQLVWLSSILDD